MNLLSTGFPVANVIVPKGGPRVVSANLDFSNQAEIDIDGQAVIDAGQIEYLQGVFIDNADNPDKFELRIGQTNQRIVAKGNTQGYYPIMAPNPPKMTAATVQLANRVVPVFFYNVPIQAAVWASE